MFSRFLGRSDSPDPEREAPDSRGLEVKEDDPDTAWSMWDSALAEQDSRFVDLPSLSESVPLEPETVAPSAPKAPFAFPDIDIPTEPMGLEEPTPAQRMKDALDIIELYHHRIANTIRTLWGYKECSTYINKLIMNGGDGMGNARIGFNQQAADAMMVLATLHDAQFGFDHDDGPTGFGDSFFNTGINGSR